MKRSLIAPLAGPLVAAILLAAFPFAGAAQAKPVEIELWALGAVTEAGPPPADWVGYQIIRDKLGIDLKIVLQPSSQTDQNTKISVAAASNNLPDLFGVDRTLLMTIAKQGLVAQVDSLLPMMPERTKGHYADDGRNKLVKLNGKMYGLPDPGAMDRVEGLVIRKDWLDKLGLPVPKTLEELYKVGVAFTTRDPDGNGQNDTYGFGAWQEVGTIPTFGFGKRFDYIFGAYGVLGPWCFESADKFGLNVRNPNFRKGVEYIKRLNDEKLIDPMWTTPNKDEFRLRWKQGKFGIMWEQFAALHMQSNYKAFDDNFPNGEWIPIMPPTGPEGRSGNGYDTVNARIYAVSAKAMKAGKGPAIAKLLEWMATDGYYLCGFGVEGVNFNKDAKGDIVLDGIPAEKRYSHASQQNLTQLRNMVYINNDIELKVRYQDYKSKNGKTISPLATWKFFKNTPYVAAAGASLIDKPTNYADFVRYYEENLIKFALGQQPLDDKSWGDFLKGLDSLGAREWEKAAKAKLLENGLLD